MDRSHRHGSAGMRGAHIIVEYHGCDPARLDHQKTIRRTLRRAAEAAGATVLDVHVRPYDPQGVAGVALLAESHLSVHTWPEARYAAADLYTCGLAEPRRAHDVMQRELRATRVEVLEIARGLAGGASSLSVISQESHQPGPGPRAQVRIDVRDGKRHGVRAVRHGESLGLEAVRAFLPGEPVFPLESILYPADAEFVFDTDAGEIPLGLDWDWRDVSPKWLELLPANLSHRLFQLHEIPPGEFRALFDRLTAAGACTRMVATFGEAARHSAAPNVVPSIEGLELQPGGVLSLPFIATGPIAIGEEIVWDHSMLDPSRVP